MDKKERFKAILSSKDTWFWAAGSALLITVLGATMTPHKANAMLAIAVLAFSAAIFFNHNLADDHVGVRLLWTLAVGGFAGLFVYHFLWTPQGKPEGLQLDYRVTGGEDRGWKVGTKDEFKTILLEMQLINRSRRKMMLEIHMEVPWTRPDGHTISVHFRGKWSDNKDETRIADGSTEYPFAAAAYETLTIEAESAIERKVLFEVWDYRALTASEMKSGPFLKWSEIGSPRTLTIRDRISGEVIADASTFGYPEESVVPYLSFTYPAEDLSEETLKWAKENGYPNPSDPVQVELKAIEGVKADVEWMDEQER
jgi:hypothetical protein